MAIEQTKLAHPAVDETCLGTTQAAVRQTRPEAAQAAIQQTSPGAAQDAVGQTAQDYIPKHRNTETRCFDILQKRNNRKKRFVLDSVDTSFDFTSVVSKDTPDNKFSKTGGFFK